MKTTLGSHPADVSAQGHLSRPRLVFLVGFMGAGKTSVGKALARRLGWDFEDLDERVVAREGRKIEEIFRESGEVEFRRVEHAALRALLQEACSVSRVVALGGGAFVQPENALLLTQSGAPAVFLNAPVEVLFKRCQQEADLERPLRRREQEFRELYQARLPHYRKATLCVETGGQDIDSVAEAVAKGLGLRSE